MAATVRLTDKPYTQALIWRGAFGMACATAVSGREDLFSIPNNDLASAVSQNAEHAFYLIVEDEINWENLQSAESILRDIGASWAFFSLHNSYAAISPVFGKNSSICVRCMERRLVSYPIDGMDPKIDAQRRREVDREAMIGHSAFTPALVRLAIGAAERMRSLPPGSPPRVTFIDQLGLRHLSIQLSALHGCDDCRPSVGQRVDRFTRDIAEWLDEIPA